MSAMTHIVGLDIRVGCQIRQRCGWCGAVLIDEDLHAVAIATEDLTADRPIPVWPVGALVRTDGCLTEVVEHEDGADLPDDACGQLDHAVTGARGPT